MTQQWNLFGRPADSMPSSGSVGSPARQLNRCLNGLFSLLEMLSEVPTNPDPIELALAVGDQRIGRLCLQEGKLIHAEQAVPAHGMSSWCVPEKHTQVWESLQQGLSQGHFGWLQEALAQRTLRLKEVRLLWPLVVGRELLQMVLQIGKRPVNVRASNTKATLKDLSVPLSEILLNTAAALDSVESDSASMIFEDHCHNASKLGADYVDYGEAAILFFNSTSKNSLPIPLKMRGFKRELSLAEIKNLAEAAHHMQRNLKDSSEPNRLGTFTIGDDSWVCHAGDTRLALIRTTDQWLQVLGTLKPN